MQLIIALLIVALSASPAFAAPTTYAINLSCGTNGNGDGWACGTGVGKAMNTLPTPGTLVRDGTYYISAGTLTLNN